MRLVCYALERVRAGVRSADRRARARAVGPAGLLGEAGWLAGGVGESAGEKEGRLAGRLGCRRKS